MVVIFAFVAAALYGTADFLGGAASRRAPALAVLCVTATFGEIILIAAALVAGGPLRMAGLPWALAGGAAGAFGLVVFYVGLATTRMSVVAPVSALVSTVLPVGVAVAGGERPSLLVAIGAVICLVAIILVSMEGSAAGPRGRGGSLRGLGYGVAAGVGFGLFLICLKNAGTSGVWWPSAMAGLAGAVIALAAAGLTRTRPVWWRTSPGTFGMALASGVFDSLANVSYVVATREGLFGLAVVITSLYPGVTVLLARLTLGERIHLIQRVGLALAATGVVMLTV
ncbi:MAG TPA: DMT family transporter [Streptosporangiaceae bacterium]|nr:DMT family transporter [Streptosporangiaceae bacterium]